MALITAAGCASIVVLLFLLAAAFGNRLLKLADLDPQQPLENVLFSMAAGFAALQFLLTVFAWVIGLTRVTCVGLLMILAISAGRGWSTLLGLLRQCLFEFHRAVSSRVTRLLSFSISFFIVLETLLATAPISGSDALHYHFATPLLELGKPQRPILWLTHSFFTGIGHQLIGLGLALGSDRIALVLILLGGFATAAALLQLARQWMSKDWALTAVLIFVATPMVFWQSTTAGAPDIWIAFYVVMAVLAASRKAEPDSQRWLLLASVYAGAAAGFKYTGWIIPIVIVIYAFWASRSIRLSISCSVAAMVTGGLPLLRNVVWTGDPFFPFLDHWIGLIAANPYGLQALQSDTRAQTFSMRPLHLLAYPFELILRGNAYGVGHYFGPIVLAFSPLLIFCRWRERSVWLAGAMWLSIFGSNALTTQMGRFLLPTYPLALCLVLYGAMMASLGGRKLIRLACATTLVLFALFSLASDVAYAKDFLPVAVGMESREAFLSRMAPDYQTSRFLNSALAGRDGKTLVFFRHLYYLKIPYVNGDPTTSWLVDPARLKSVQEVLEFLRSQDIRWVIKSPGYPLPISAAFDECEQEGYLVPYARTQVENLTSTSRILNVRVKVPVVVMGFVPNPKKPQDPSHPNL